MLVPRRVNQFILPYTSSNKVHTLLFSRTIQMGLRLVTTSHQPWSPACKVRFLEFYKYSVEDGLPVDASMVNKPWWSFSSPKDRVVGKWPHENCFWFSNGRDPITTGPGSPFDVPLRIFTESDLFNRKRPLQQPQQKKAWNKNNQQNWSFRTFTHV